MYYAHQIAMDETTEHETWRDRIEYLARFWNSEGVDQVQRAREQKKGQTDTAFDSFLETQFGRTLGGPRETSVDELGQEIDQMAAQEDPNSYDVVQVVGEDGAAHEQLSSFSPRYSEVAREQQKAVERAQRER